MMENPIEMDDLGVPPFQETIIYLPIASSTRGCPAFIGGIKRLVVQRTEGALYSRYPVVKKDRFGSQKYFGQIFQSNQALQEI